MSDSTYLASIYQLTAVNFQMSAKILHDEFNYRNESTVRNRRAIPFYYLLSHACELLLKCALIKRGVDEAKLKNPKLRHNLCNLLAELEKNEVAVSSESKEILKFLNEQHSSHSLRYKALQCMVVLNIR